MTKIAYIFSLFMIFLVILAISLVVGFPTTNPAAPEAGFFKGLWHGATIIVSLIGSLIDNEINIYPVSNTGFWYNLGFLLGAGSSIKIISFQKWKEEWEEDEE